MNKPSDKLEYQVQANRIDAHGSVVRCKDSEIALGTDLVVRQDVPPRMESIEYEIRVDTDESDVRLDLLHENVKKYGAVFNTVAPGTLLRGVLKRT